MAQSAKFIDVTKTFIPCDPNAFPESMQGTAREDAPENRIPSAAYAGYNFLPTSYGYKSYFGIASKVNIDNLTVRVDHIILFQTETFENLLIALTEEGIFIKNGSGTGAWTQVKVIVPPVAPDIHFDWSYTVIGDEFYAYQAGQPKYQKISSLASAPYYTFTEVTPTFLNMAGQVGIFRAAGQLGFWDTADSVSWSNIDNLADFEPSTETLAGNALFSDVNGRITTIKSSGNGFIIYASKSVVQILNDAAATMQWKPNVILSNSGVSYPPEVTVGVPDTMQFAYTNTGLYQIDNGQEKLIVPEVTDFLKVAKGPKYPHILQGRYLFIELLDKDYIDGLTNFTDEIVQTPPITFPGASGSLTDATDAIIFRSDSPCAVIHNIAGGGYNETQGTKGTGGGNNLPGQKPGTLAQPVWTCYISHRAGPPQDLTWGATPCPTANLDGVEQNMCPVSPGHKLTDTTTTGVGKTPLTGADLYVDGKWTMERFISVQTAIWEKEQQELSQYIATMLNRSKSQQKASTATTCTETNNKSSCGLGTFVTDYSSPVFGYSACSFWLTRFALRAGAISVKKSTKRTCAFNAEQRTSGSIKWGGAITGMDYLWDTPDDACKNIPANIQPTAFASPSPVPPPPTPQATFCYTPPMAAMGYNVYGVRWCPAGYSIGSGDGLNFCYIAAFYNITDSFYAYNDIEYVDIGDARPETAYCVISGWTYEKTDGTTATVSANTCTAPKKLGTGGNPSYGAGGDAKKNEGPVVPISSEGEICFAPFQPVVLPGTPGTSVNWPDQTVQFPDGTFLLQKGSIGPIYPIFQGALVYDLQLKKWGKIKQDYKLLVDYQAINDQSGGAIPYDRFGMQGGVLKTNGGLYLFDEFPEDSQITYGKIGYYRLGMTSPEEVRVDFRSPGIGQLVLETSLDGRNIQTSLTRQVDFNNVNTASLDGGLTGRWHNVTIKGYYDIAYLEFRGVGNKGRR